MLHIVSGLVNQHLNNQVLLVQLEQQVLGLVLLVKDYRNTVLQTKYSYILHIVFG
jgi:hypothetical protein